MPLAEQRGSGAGAVVGDRESQFFLAGDVGDELAQPGEERLAWLAGGGEFVATGAQCGDLVGVHSDDQVTAGGEMPVHGRVSHTRAARDVVERCVDAVFGEDVLGGGQQERSIALGVRAARPSPQPGGPVDVTCWHVPQPINVHRELRLAEQTGQVVVDGPHDVVELTTAVQQLHTESVDAGHQQVGLALGVDPAHEFT